MGRGYLCKVWVNVEQKYWRECVRSLLMTTQRLPGRSGASKEISLGPSDKVELPVTAGSWMWLRQDWEGGGVTE